MAAGQVSLIGRGIDNDVVGLFADAAFEHGFEGVIGEVIVDVLGVEGEVIAKQHVASWCVGEGFQEGRQQGHIVLLDIDKQEFIGCFFLLIDVVDCGFDEGAFSHAFCAPEQGVVGGLAAGEGMGVL